MTDTEKNSCPSILIKTQLSVSSLEEMGWKDFIGIQCDSRLGFYAIGLHHDGIVIECDGIIAPGTQGSANFLMNSDALFDTEVRVGSTVELRRGATIVAIAEILTMESVTVVTDPRHEHGCEVVHSAQ